MMKILKIALSLLILFNLSVAFAGVTDHFKIEFNKKTTGIGEALDLTITALDKNDEVVKDYTGNVFGFSETDDSIELPEELSNDDGYSFKLSDEGVKKFENGIKFNTSGEQSISLYDANDYENVTGKGEINIKESQLDERKVEIEILTPESNTTLPTNKLILSGKTVKNHQIKIELNNKTEFTTTSNSDGIFEKEIEGLITGENILKAFTLDSDENIIGESIEVTVKIDDNKPTFKKIVLSPLSDSGAVEENTSLEVKVFSNAGLESVKLLFNDGVITLSETEKGIYTGGFKAPTEENTFPIDVVLSNNLGQTVTEEDAIKIDVFLVETNSASEVKEDNPNLKIDGLKLVRLKSKSVLSWDKLDDAKNYDVFKKNESSGDFEFLKNVDEPKFEIEITGEEIKHQYFAVKAKTETASGELITGDLSEATKVQTGPTEIILMLLLSLMLGFGFMIFKRKAS